MRPRKISYQPPSTNIVFSSPSTHQSLTASATTRRWLSVGQTLKHWLVHAHYYAFTWLHRLHMQTTSPWMETPRTSIANPWPRLPPVPYKTKFSHLGRKSSNSWPPLSTFGTGKTHCFRFLTAMSHVCMGWMLATALRPTLPPHHSPRHHQVPQHFPWCCFPQWRQTSNITSDLLPMMILLEPDLNILWSGHLSQIYDTPPSNNINHHRKDPKRFSKTYPWALGASRDLPNYFLPKRKKQLTPGRPIVSFFTSPFRPMLSCIAKPLYQLIPATFPHNLAQGDVFNLIKRLQELDFDTINLPRLYNQDLAGFFTRIDPQRFVDSWHLMLQYLTSTMSTHPDEIILVKPSTGNHAGDVVKGRTCRTLNVTRKIYIRDVEPIIVLFVQMAQFPIGACFEQIRGSPMGSPPSPALCPMVPGLSHFRKKYGIARSNPPWRQWTWPHDFSARWTTDCVWLTFIGSTTGLCDIPSPAVLRFADYLGDWTQPGILAWVSASSLNPLLFGILDVATSIKWWLRFRLRLFLYSFRVLFPAYFLSPNVFFLRVLLCPDVERKLATYDDEDDDENNGRQRDGSSFATGLE